METPILEMKMFIPGREKFPSQNANIFSWNNKKELKTEFHFYFSFAMQTNSFIHNGIKVASIVINSAKKHVADGKCISLFALLHLELIKEKKNWKMIKKFIFNKIMKKNEKFSSLNFKLFLICDNLNFYLGIFIFI